MAKVFYRRNFLNTVQNGGMAAVEAEIFEADSHYVSASFDLTDCNRKVSLDFCAHDEEGASNVRQKIRQLRLTLTAFEKALLAEIDKVFPQ